MKFGYYCSCALGFKIAERNPHECEDVDECKIFGKCSQKCLNFIGGFKCSCFEGYQLSRSKDVPVCKIEGT